MDISQVKELGDIAEQKVLSALSSLPSPWQIFNTVEWRNIGNYGEEVGEADVVVFNPQYGLIVFEIKAGNVYLKDGQWFYASGKPMKQSPLSQARRNRYALMKRLELKLGTDVNKLNITHAVWFPDVRWQAAITLLEAPSINFIFDKTCLANPEPRLLKIFFELSNNFVTWTKTQQRLLKELLAPDCHLLVPLASKIDDTVHQLLTATEQQINILRLLRHQQRLLVEGGAGSGKTLLAVTLAREHALLGKDVLLTCFNKALALQLKLSLADYPNITVIHFHDLVRLACEQSGTPYDVPEDKEALSLFFQEGCADLLLHAVEQGAKKYDTIIVDEAADFRTTWWIAIEALGLPAFSWYCFYDKHQAIFWEHEPWHAPFAAQVMPLEVNLRNTQPVGTLAANLGHCPLPADFRIKSGIKPELCVCDDFDVMATKLQQLLHHLINEEQVSPERIAILSPYRYTNLKSTWSNGLKTFVVNEEVATPIKGQIAIATIQSFKGLESDIVILVGITKQSANNKELLYVGASRAKVGLYILSLVELDQQKKSVRHE